MEQASRFAKDLFRNLKELKQGKQKKQPLSLYFPITLRLILHPFPDACSSSSFLCFPASEEVIRYSLTNHLPLQKHKFTCHERNWFDPVANNPHRASPQQFRLFFSRGWKGVRIIRALKFLSYPRSLFIFKFKQLGLVEQQVLNKF